MVLLLVRVLLVQVLVVLVVLVTLLLRMKLLLGVALLLQLVALGRGANSQRRSLEALQQQRERATADPTWPSADRSKVGDWPRVQQEREGHGLAGAGADGIPLSPRLERGQGKWLQLETRTPLHLLWKGNSPSSSPKAEGAVAEGSVLAYLVH